MTMKLGKDGQNSGAYTGPKVSSVLDYDAKSGSRTPDRSPPGGNQALQRRDGLGKGVPDAKVRISSGANNNGPQLGK